jgi:poly(A) polymerase
MELLGVSGRDVGRALKHLLALRMERGPLPRDEAVAECGPGPPSRGSPSPR